MLKINAHPESCAGAGHALAMEGQRDWVNFVKFVNNFGSTFFEDFFLRTSLRKLY